MTAYEQKLAALGITGGESLRKGFVDREGGGLRANRDKYYIDPKASLKIEPPPLPDLSHLNPVVNGRCQNVAKNWWAKMTPAQREAKRAEFRLTHAKAKAVRLGISLEEALKIPAKK